MLWVGVLWADFLGDGGECVGGLWALGVGVEGTGWVEGEGGRCVMWLDVLLRVQCEPHLTSIGYMYSTLSCAPSPAS